MQRSLNPGRRMRESEPLFQVILTQVACTRQSVGEEGVKVHRLLWRATCGAAAGAGGMAVVCVCVCVCVREGEREGNHLTCQVGNQVANTGCLCRGASPLHKQPRQALVLASQLSSRRPTIQGGSRQTGENVCQKGIAYFRSGKGTNGIPQIMAKYVLQLHGGFGHITCIDDRPNT